MIEGWPRPVRFRRKNGKSQESSSPLVDKRRCSNNENDGKSKVRRREDRKSVEADSRCDDCYGGKAWDIPIDARLGTCPISETIFAPVSCPDSLHIAAGYTAVLDLGWTIRTLVWAARSLLLQRSWRTSALIRIPDSGRTSREVSKVPQSDIGSLKHLVGSCKKMRRQVEAESRGCLCINHKLQMR